MSDDRQGWTQWREGNTLHEVRPAWCNDWQTIHTTYYGWFSPESVRSRRRAGEYLYNEVMKNSFIAKFLANKISDIPPNIG